MKKIKIEALNSVFDTTDIEKIVFQETEAKNFPQEVVFIATTEIIPGKYQPRKKFDEETLQELAISIKSNGILQPILVKQDHINGNYEIVAGERRWRASKIAGVSHIPCIVIDIDAATCSSFALLENIQRDALTAFEEAKAYQKLVKEFSLTHDEISKKTGKSRVYITNSLRLLSLSRYITDSLDVGKISVGHAKVILSCDSEKRDNLCKQIIHKGLSVRDSELLLKNMRLSSKKSSENQIKLNSKLQIMQNKLVNIFGQTVKLKESLDGSVMITLKMKSIEKLEKIVDKLHNLENGV